MKCENEQTYLNLPPPPRKNEYESYFEELGVTNITIFSDRLIDTPPDASYMEEVVAVFATPPNSYSAVVDPIDLVIISLKVICSLVLVIED